MRPGDDGVQYLKLLVSRYYSAPQPFQSLQLSQGRMPDIL